MVLTVVDAPVVTPTAVAGANYAYLLIQNGDGATRSFTLHSLALTVSPLGAGAAETPGDGTGDQGKSQP